MSRRGADSVGELSLPKLGNVLRSDKRGLVTEYNLLDQISYLYLCSAFRVSAKEGEGRGKPGNDCWLWESSKGLDAPGRH